MKVYSEEETKARIFNLAAQQGCLNEVKQTLERYENLLRRCKNIKEKEEISILGNVEIHNLLNIKGGLTVNRKEIIPPDPDIENIIKKQKDI